VFLCQIDAKLSRNALQLVVLQNDSL
jgi:hypothetical protein